MVTERELTIRVEPIYKETVRRRTGAARLIPTELVDPKVIRLPQCTEKTFRSFSGVPEASIWQLNLLYVGIDPDVVPEDRRHAQKVLNVLLDPTVYSDGPMLQQFQSNLLRTEQAIENGELSVLESIPGNPDPNHDVNVSVFTKWAEHVRLPRPSHTAGTRVSRASYTTPVLAAIAAIVERFYGEGYDSNDWTTHTHPSIILGEIGRMGLSKTEVGLVHRVTRDPKVKGRPPKVMPRVSVRSATSR